MESGDLVERRYGAAVVGWNRTAGVADKEGPMEAAEHVGGHHGRVFVFLTSGHCGAVNVPVGVCSDIVGAVAGRRLVCWAVDEAIGVICYVAVVAIRGDVVALCLVAIGQWMTADERGCKMDGLALRRKQVVCNVLDEDTLALNCAWIWVSVWVSSAVHARHRFSHQSD